MFNLLELFFVVDSPQPRHRINSLGLGVRDLSGLLFVSFQLSPIPYRQSTEWIFSGLLNGSAEARPHFPRSILSDLLL